MSSTYEERGVQGLARPSAVLHGDEVRELERRLEHQFSGPAQPKSWGVVEHICRDAIALASRLQSELDRLRGCEIDTRRFEQAPCYLCGYNSHSYYQPSVHKCAARYHAAIDAATEARTLSDGSGSRSDEQDERKESGGGRTSG